MNRRDRLSDWLDGYRPHDPIERAYQQQMLNLLAGDGDPFSRAHFQPGHFTASAFVLGAPDSGDPAIAESEVGSRDVSPPVLMIFHRRLNRWLQPGGHVEPDDSDLRVAAQREVAEETGLQDLLPVGFGRTPIFDLDVHTIPGNEKQPEHQHLDVRFLFQSKSHSLAPATDASAARWVPPLEASRLNLELAMARVLYKLRTFLETPTSGDCMPDTTCSAESPGIQGEP